MIYRYVCICAILLFYVKQLDVNCLKLLSVFQIVKSMVHIKILNIKIKILVASYHVILPTQKKIFISVLEFQLLR